MGIDSVAAMADQISKGQTDNLQTVARLYLAELSRCVQSYFDRTPASALGAIRIPAPQNDLERAVLDAFWRELGS